MNGKRKLFENIEDIYKELEMCYDEIIEKGISNKSKTLYEEHFYFCNTYDLLDEKYQQTINFEECSIRVERTRNDQKPRRH